MSVIQNYKNTFTQPFQYSEDLLWTLLKTLLTEKRFNHVQRVFDTALKLTNQLNFDENQIARVRQVVLFHDLAKGMKDHELFEYAQEYGIELGDVPAPIYHAIVGAWLAREFFLIEDYKVLDAVEFHTTGSALFLENEIGAVLFLADYLEPGRNLETAHIWEHIPSNVGYALRETLKDKICSVIRRDRVLDEESLNFYHSLIK